MPEPAVLYVRVSTLDQSQHGVSIEAQIERLRSYARSANLDIIRLIKEEGVSASKPLDIRPGGSELLRMLNEKEATHVVAMKLDRLFRSTEDALHRVKDWEARGVTLHLTDLGGTSLNSRSAIGKVMLTLLSAFGEFERNLIAERTSTALAHKKRHGRVFNHLPYGFDRDGDNLIPSDKEQKVLRQIFTWRKEGESLSAIANRLNDLGVLSKTGGKWHAGTIAHMIKNIDLHQRTAIFA